MTFRYKHLVQTHEASIGVMSTNKFDDNHNNTNNTQDHRTRQETEDARLMEQRCHVRKAMHIVKQKMNNLNTQLNQVMLQTVVSKMDVVDFCSPPRIASMAAQMGLRVGWNMGITTQDDDGIAWDFNVLEMRNRAARRVLKDKPVLLIGSPVRMIHSAMNIANHVHMDLELVAARFRYARKYLEFATKFSKLQVESGRYFLHGHPEGAQKWHEKCIREVLEMDGGHESDWRPMPVRAKVT